LSASGHKKWKIKMDDFKNATAPTYRASDQPMYQDVIAADIRPAPAVFREYSEVDVNVPRVPRSRYISKAFFDLEIERMWPRVWQLACREEQIPEAGDCVLYESPGASFIIARGDDGKIRAFYNSCLHRGMRLCAADTSVSELKCPYHGFTWNLDGSLAKIPAKWDFSHVKDSELSLPEARVECWGGFVFINRDAEAPPLADYLANLPEHFSAWPRDDVYLAIHLRKTIRANWKGCIEGFIEAFHVAELHSQALPFGGDSSTQYDVWPGNENISRFVEPSGIQSDQYPSILNQQEIYRAMMKTMTGSDQVPELPAGKTAREVVAEMSRTVMSELDGRDYSGLSDAESIDPAQYSIFPNIVIFRSLGYPYVYRFLPCRDDPHSTVFDFMTFKPKPLDGSPIPEVRMIDLGPDDTYRDSGAFPPWLGEIYDQDSGGLGMLQEGLRAGHDSPVIFSRYQEVRLRLLHQTLSRYVGEEAPAA
jgi:phenylpropionate dioxygenase-like ring-hydroxylating dioxygenase large terminal subunit